MWRYAWQWTDEQARQLLWGLSQTLVSAVSFVAVGLGVHLQKPLLLF